MMNFTSGGDVSPVGWPGNLLREEKKMLNIAIINIENSQPLCGIKLNPGPNPRDIIKTSLLAPGAQLGNSVHRGAIFPPRATDFWREPDGEKPREKILRATLLAGTV